MSQGKRANIGHSIFQKLLNHARTSSVDFNLLLIRYGTERLLYRLSASPHKGNFILKGASLFLIWMGQTYRVTKDVDLLGFGEANTATIARFFKSLCQMSVKTNDGIQFLPETVRAAPIREDNLYDGIRVTLLAILHQARIPLQIDIGFGDAVTPKPDWIEFPTILDDPAPQLLAYPKYTMVAEKLETMVRLGMVNSRMKDFYDVWLVSHFFEFDGATLCDALRNTFSRRSTPFPADLPISFSPEFRNDTQKNNQWQAFVRKSKPEYRTDNLDTVIQKITAFLLPVIEVARTDKSFSKFWTPKGPWANL